MDHSEARIAIQMQDAVRLSGMSKNTLYRRIQAGDIRAVKSGRSTLILMKSLVEHLEGLPAARIGKGYAA